MHFAQVYRFVGDIFDPDTPCHIEAHLQKLKHMDGITVKTVSVLQYCSLYSLYLANDHLQYQVSPALLP
jgi:hypothetical protein